MCRNTTIATLSKLGIDSRVTAIVWHRLEEENPEFFETYNGYDCDEGNVSVEPNLAPEDKAGGVSMSRCSSSCSIATLPLENNVLGFYCCH